MCNFLIVGFGICASIFAREAGDRGYKVLVVEKCKKKRIP